MKSRCQYTKLGSLMLAAPNSERAVVVWRRDVWSELPRQSITSQGRQDKPQTDMMSFGALSTARSFTIARIAIQVPKLLAGDAMWAALTGILLALCFGRDANRLLAVSRLRDAIMRHLGLGRWNRRRFGRKQRRLSGCCSMGLKAEQDAQGDGDGDGQQRSVDEDADRHRGCLSWRWGW